MVGLCREKEKRALWFSAASIENLSNIEKYGLSAIPWTWPMRQCFVLNLHCSFGNCPSLDRNLGYYKRFCFDRSALCVYILVYILRSSRESCLREEERSQVEWRDDCITVLSWAYKSLAITTFYSGHCEKDLDSPQNGFATHYLPLFWSRKVGPWRGSEVSVFRQACDICQCGTWRLVASSWKMRESTLKKSAMPMTALGRKPVINYTSMDLLELESFPRFSMGVE